MVCLDERRLRQYLRGVLPVDELAASADHVRTCESCRKALATLSDYTSAAVRIGDAVLTVAECPEYEQLSAFVSDILDHESHTSVEQHLSSCELCWCDVETLQAARSRASLAPAIAVRQGHFARHRSRTALTWRRALGLAAGAAAVVAVAVTISHQPTPVKNHDVIAVVPNAASPTSVTTTTNNVPPGKRAGEGEAKQSVKPVPHLPLQNPKPVFVAQLHDGNIVVGNESGKLSVRSNGKDLEAELARLIGPKLRDGRIKSQKYAMAGGGVRGPGASHISIVRLAPTAGGQADAMPELRWQPVDGADSYRVEIYDSKGNTVFVLESTETTVRPSVKLQAGAYAWIVWVRRGAMAEPIASNAASFIVLSAKDRALIARAKQDYPKSHLVLGTVYESLGLDKDAVGEFQALSAQNPGSPIAGRLLAGARTRLKD